MPKLSKSFYAGVFLLSIGMMGAQFLLTRILSVVVWYHFVFMIISIVMFSLTAGTLLIYFFSRIFSFQKTMKHITQCVVLCGIAIFVTFISLFYLPGILVSVCHFDMQDIVHWYFPILIIPFFMMGMAFSLILTRFPQSIGKIYGVNLIGSAVGCLAAYVILNSFNGASTVLIFSAIFLLAAICFAVNIPGIKKNFLCFLGILISCFLAGAIINQQTDGIQMIWNKDRYNYNLPIYSKWNFFSQVSVRIPSFYPFGWGYSPKVWNMPIKTQELMIVIDEGAGTVITEFKDIADLDYLNMDISSLVYYIRPPKVALIIGAGGGRDVMAAVINGASKVIGVEINNDVINIAYHKINNLILKFPQIQIRNDDGRSFIARSSDHYDLIQASLVDSYSAASSGAFALSENSLYTKEAWVAYLRHLTPTGVLTFSRWHTKNAMEIYRLLTLTKSALHEVGIRDYRDHILLARARGNELWPDVGTILVSLTPFTDQEIKEFQKISNDMEFEVTLTKYKSFDPVFERIFEGDGDTYRFPSVRGNIDPPTDNKPFYFYFSDFKNFFNDVAEGEGPRILKAVTLLIIFFGVCFLLVPFLIVPQSRGLDKIQFLPTLYFSSIGFAFMFIEIPLIQRLGIFLGHPIYGLTVVLFSLLLSCGLGSIYSKKVQSMSHFRILARILLVMILLIAFLLPVVIQETMSVSVAIKIFISLLSVSCIGFLMGIPFPLGVTKVSLRPQTPLIFYWAVNGFASMSLLRLRRSY
jgi:hypothetical protein